MKNERILANGIAISNDTRVTGLNNNDLIIGSSGLGKTGGYVIPNLQNLTDSIVVSDTKGQLTKMFSKQLKLRRYKVCTLDLVNLEKSCGYNPLNGIRRYKSGKYREQDVLTLANNIV
ncbi:MAG: type IV secretory system conjugative DNA transfer family protein, partial [Oscillospiraceae bacterium]|nr:type IV secretory system conjugative DNA transfer family protein [Oscillospiraceae bacterium]